MECNVMYACINGMVWYGTVWYGMVWYGYYGMVWLLLYGMVWYGMVWYLHEFISRSR